MSNTFDGGLDASNLVYLFADRFVPLATGRGPVVYGRTDRKVAVDRRQLAVTLIAVSIWGLRESGLVRVEQRQEKKLGFVKVNRTRMWPAGAGLPSGDLERRVLGVVQQKVRDEGASEYDVVRGFVPQAEDPHRWVIGTVTSDTARHGYLLEQRDEKGRLDGFTPVVERIAALEPSAANLAERWTKFCAAEPEMLKPLRSHIETALHGKVELDDD